MFDFFRKKRITKYTDNASEYLQQTFTPEAPRPEVKPAPKVTTKQPCARILTAPVVCHPPMTT